MSFEEADVRTIETGRYCAHCLLHTAHCTVDIVHTAHCLLCTLHTAHTVHTAQSILSTLHTVSHLTVFAPQESEIKSPKSKLALHRYLNLQPKITQCSKGTIRYFQIRYLGFGTNFRMLLEGMRQVCNCRNFTQSPEPIHFL